MATTTSGNETIEKHIEDDEVTAWILGELGAGMPVLPQVGSLLAAIARSTAAQSETNPQLGKTGAINEVLRKHWLPNLPGRS